MREVEINIINSENSAKADYDKLVIKNIFKENPSLYLLKKKGKYTLEVKPHHLTVVFNYKSDGYLQWGANSNKTNLVPSQCLICMQNNGGCMSIQKLVNSGDFIILECDSDYNQSPDCSNKQHLHHLTPSENFLLERIVQNIDKLQDLNGLEIKSEIYKLMSLQWENFLDSNKFHEGLDKIKVTNENYKKTLEAKKILDDNIKDNISIPDLALKVGTNQQYLKKHFKILFDKTINEYKTEIKMEFAKKLLESKKMAVWEVAQEVGYNYTSHFINVYKKYFGVSPSNSK